MKKAKNAKSRAKRTTKAELEQMLAEMQAKFEEQDKKIQQQDKEKADLLLKIEERDNQIIEMKTTKKKGTTRRGDKALSCYAIRSAIVIAYWAKKFNTLLLDEENDDFCSKFTLNNRQMKKALIYGCSQGLGKFMFSSSKAIRDHICLKDDVQKTSIKQIVNDEEFEKMEAYMEENKTYLIPFSNDEQQYVYSIINASNWAYTSDYGYSGSQFGGPTGIARFFIYMNSKNPSSLVSASAKDKNGNYRRELNTFTFELLSDHKKQADHRPQKEMLVDLLKIADLLKKDPKMFIQSLTEIANKNKK